MFFWKVKVGDKSATETKDNDEKPSEDAAENKSTHQESKDNNDEKPSEAESEKKSSKTLKESVDRTVYKILTRQRQKRSNPMKKKENEKEADIGEVKWRGPREQQSEVPIQRKIHSVRN